MRNTKEIRVIKTLLLSALFSLPAVSQIVERFQEGMYSFQGTSLPYRLFVPENYDSLQRYPLILFLHGAGERGVDNYKPVNDNLGAQLFASDSHQSKHPAFILAPQCPAAPQQWVDVPWSRGSYNQDLLPISNELRTVYQLLDSVRTSHSIDSNRIYAVGSSMGGYGTWDIITRYPQTFAAAIAVVGGGDPAKAQLIQHMGIWAHHGTSDRTVPVTGSRNMMLALDSLGSTPFFTNCNWENCDGPALQDVEDSLTVEDPPRHIYSEYSGLGHELWYSAYSQFEGMADWLFSFSKKEDPVNIGLTDGQNSIELFRIRNRLYIHGPNDMVASLYDIAGKKIPLYKDKTHVINVSTEGWDSGLYILEVHSKSGSKTVKVFAP